MSIVLHLQQQVLYNKIIARKIGVAYFLYFNIIQLCAQIDYTNMRTLWRTATYLARKAFVRSIYARKELFLTVAKPCKLLFPGQGSQYVGMTSKLPNDPAVERVYSVASHVLGYDLRALCVGGPQQELDKTVHCQPAVVVASLAASLVCLKSRHEATKVLSLLRTLF